MRETPPLLPLERVSRSEPALVTHPQIRSIRQFTFQLKQGIRQVLTLAGNIKIRTAKVQRNVDYNGVAIFVELDSCDCIQPALRDVPVKERNFRPVHGELTIFHWLPRVSPRRESRPIRAIGFLTRRESPTSPI